MTPPTKERVEEIRRLRQNDRDICHWGHVGELLEAYDAQSAAIDRAFSCLTNGQRNLAWVFLHQATLGIFPGDWSVTKEMDDEARRALAKSDEQAEALKVAKACEAIARLNELEAK